MLSNLKFLGLLLALTIAVIPTTAQDEPTPATLAETLFPVFAPVPNAVASFLFPLSIITAQTPIQVRYTLMFTAIVRDIYAVCEPNSLSFFGINDVVPESFCAPDNNAILLSYTLRKGLISDFPAEMAAYTTFLINAGLNPTDASTDTSTIIGWANVHGSKYANYFANDGWNSLGISKFFAQRFADTTNYQPRNHPGVSPSDLRFPLRWQPLTQSYDGNGNFADQVHLTPHIGLTGRPFTLTQKEFRARRVRPLYKIPNSHKEISPPDEKLARKLIDELLERNREMNDRKLAIATWWDNKFLSLGRIIVYFELMFGFSNRRFYSAWLIETIALHDAVLLAWKEKRRFDAVRPQTLMRRLLANEKITAWRGQQNGVGDVAVEEWETAVRTMPHSEYPSATATLCSASLEGMGRLYLDEFGDNATLPKLEVTLNVGEIPGVTIQKPLTFQYRDFKQAAYGCGQSRLWTGLHFRPAVGQGHKLGTGIGNKAVAIIKDLDDGRVPKNCHWCNSE